MTTSHVYRNPVPGKALITTISSSCRSPILEVKFCNLLNPFYYTNSPTVPRYSITCIVDPETHKDFLSSIQTIEKNEKVDSVLKNETVKDGEILVTTGKVLLKFQSKNQIPIFIGNEDELKNDSQPHTLELQDELAKGERIMVIYDITRYTKKNTMKTEHGISFKPSCIYYFPKKGE